MDPHASLPLPSPFLPTPGMTADTTTVPSRVQSESNTTPFTQPAPSTPAGATLAPQYSSSLPCITRLSPAPLSVSILLSEAPPRRPSARRPRRSRSDHAVTNHAIKPSPHGPLEHTKLTHVDILACIPLPTLFSAVEHLRLPSMSHLSGSPWVISCSPLPPCSMSTSYGHRGPLPFSPT